MDKMIDDLKWYPPKNWVVYNKKTNRNETIVPGNKLDYAIDLMKAMNHGHESNPLYAVRRKE